MRDEIKAKVESKYLGLWSLAQVIGLFLSFTVAGTVYTALVESGVLPANSGFAVIFIMQAVMVVLCYRVVKPVTVEGLRAGAQATTD